MIIIMIIIISLSLSLYIYIYICIKGGKTKAGPREGESRAPTNTTIFRGY